LTIGFGDFTPTAEPSQLKKLNENSTIGEMNYNRPYTELALEFLISYGLYRVIVLLWMLMGLRFVPLNI
jgi:hypothetical protein